MLDTTVGRVLFSEIWPEEMGFPSKPVKKADLGDLIWKCYKICGHDKTVTMLDKLKELGFREATKAGVSIGIDDMIIPKERIRKSIPRKSRSKKSRSNIAKALSPRVNVTTRSSISGRIAPTRFPTLCWIRSSTTRARMSTILSL